MPNNSEQWDQPLGQLLQELEIREFDLILIGDGSGSKWGYGIGWACVAIESGDHARRVFYGGANDGTVNVAEPLAYLIPLSWYAGKLEAAKLKGPRNIHIITDSEYVQQRGSREQSVLSGAHSVLWAAIEMLSRRGFVITWHWIERETYALNSFVDTMSKLGRVAVETDARQQAEVIETVYQCNED